MLYQDSEKKNDDLSAEVARMMVLLQTKDLEISGLRKQQRHADEHDAVGTSSVCALCQNVQTDCCRVAEQVLMAELEAAQRSQQELGDKCERLAQAEHDLGQAALQVEQLSQELATKQDQLVRMEMDRQRSEGELSKRIGELEVELAEAKVEWKSEAEASSQAQLMDGMLADECQRLQALLHSACQ
eukprot:1563854-Rhodomonas_salina.1